MSDHPNRIMTTSTDAPSCYRCFHAPVCMHHKMPTQPPMPDHAIRAYLAAIATATATACAHYSPPPADGVPTQAASWVLDLHPSDLRLAVAALQAAALHAEDATTYRLNVEAARKLEDVANAIDR